MIGRAAWLTDRACRPQPAGPPRDQAAARRARDLTVAEAMLEQPAALGDRTLFEILLMARGIGRIGLGELNQRAIDDGVNLATLQDADRYSRRWVAANALRRSPLGAWEHLML